MTAQRACVLIADDDGVARLVAQAALEAAGFEVVVAEDGQSALRLFAELRPDCVVLDVMMPGMDGYATCRALRETAAGNDVPILILTSRDDVGAVAGAYESGATDFTTKGISTRLLVERVRFLLRGYEARKALIVSRSRLRMVQEMTRIGQWEVDHAGRTLYVSRLIRSMLPPGDDNGRHLAQLATALRAGGGGKLLEAFRSWQTSRAPFRLEAELGTGANLYLQGITTPGSEADGEPTLTLAVQDISALRRAQRKAWRLAHFDTLTGLPNRRQFLDSLAGALRRLEPGAELAVLVIRLHGLERVQQSLGQAASDAALVQSAELVTQALGESDLGSFAHLGGGEFACYRTGPNLPATAAGMAEDVARALALPMTGEGWTANVLAGTGIVVWPSDGQDAETLLENARSTAARSAAANSSHCEFFTPQVQQQARRLLELESAMHGALERGELALAYQPRVRLADHAIRGAEALLRWRHPALGDVSPAEFVPIAERSGLIVGIGTWVLHEACRQAAAWRATFGQDRVMSVNVSAQQLRSPRALVADVQAALQAAGLPPGGLELELTESLMIDATGEALAALQELRDHGVSIALDDFGTGYSSLGYLRKLPADCLKVDRSFIADLASGPDAERLLQAILAIAAALRLRTVAEGVSTPEQLEIVRRLGCHEAQGFLLAGALDGAALEALLAGSAATAATGSQAAA